MTIIQTNDDGCGLSATHDNNNSSSTEIIRQRTSSPTQTNSPKFDHDVCRVGVGLGHYRCRLGVGCMHHLQNVHTKSSPSQGQTNTDHGSARRTDCSCPVCACCAVYDPSWTCRWCNNAIQTQVLWLFWEFRNRCMKLLLPSGKIQGRGSYTMT